jgi:hypothetical protein
MKVQSANYASRQGNIAVMSVFLLISMLSMVALTVNIGRLSNSLAHLQNANDATSKAAAWKLLDSWDAYNQVSLASGEATKLSAKTMADYGVAETLTTTDMKFGSYGWNPNSQKLEVNWGQTPANLVQTKFSRLDQRDNALDVVLRKFLGRDTMELKTISNVVFIPATGFRAPTGNQTLEILPFALDIDTWIALENGDGDDEFGVHPVTNAVSAGPDGIREVKIFPIGNDKSLPSGNRGTLRLGDNNNSTSKLSRQIREGLNANDMSSHPNGFSVAQGPMFLPGDPGVSAAIEDDLNEILGQNRILPLFTSVSGSGANASYEIVKFVGVKVVQADLRGAMQFKAVLLQPANFAVEEAESNFRMPANQFGTVFVKPMFIHID